jgi:hypothetical protein
MIPEIFRDFSQLATVAFDCLTLEDGTDILSRNVGKNLTILRCVKSPRRAQNLMQVISAILDLHAYRRTEGLSDFIKGFAGMRGRLCVRNKSECQFEG